MSQPGGPNPNSNTANQQFNQASNNSNVFANNGHNQNVTITHTHAQPHPRRTWAWIALVALLIADVASALYGQAAYSGGVNESADEIHVAIFLALVVATGLVLRVCGRDIKHRWL